MAVWPLGSVLDWCSPVIGLSMAEVVEALEPPPGSRVVEDTSPEKNEYCVTWEGSPVPGVNVTVVESPGASPMGRFAASE